jgi:hypothetical protein
MMVWESGVVAAPCVERKRGLGNEQEKEKRLEKN